MCCNGFIGKTLVEIASDKSVVSAAAALYREQVLSYKHLDEPLDEGRFVFECILLGNIQVYHL